jgi:aspartate ammonia-lyase
MAESKKKKKSSRDLMSNIRKEMNSLGEVDVAADMLWGAQTQRSLEHSSMVP